MVVLAVVTPQEENRGTNGKLVIPFENSPLRLLRVPITFLRLHLTSPCIDAAVPGAIMKFLLYIVSKDIGVSKNKTATLVSTAVELISTLATESYKFPTKEKGINNHIPFWDPASLNDTIVEVCLGKSLPGVSQISSMK